MGAAANYHCLIHGLVLGSEVELPLPQIEARRADVRYRVATRAKLPISSHSRTDDPDDPWVIEHWVGTRLAVEFPGSATFELSRTDVVLLSDDTNDPALVIHLLLDHLLPRVVALRGDLMLHAAGVVGPSGRAHLFLGATGAGKSTIAAELVASGWSLLDDDAIRVTDTDRGFRAIPGAEGLRLLTDSAMAVIPDVTPGRAISDGNPKRRFPLDGTRLRMATGPAPVAGLNLLKPTDAPAASVELLGFGDALSTITEHSFHMADEPGAIVRHAFERASALAAAIPVWRLSHPVGLDQLAGTRALIMNLDSRN